MTHRAATLAHLSAIAPTRRLLATADVDPGILRVLRAQGAQVEGLSGVPSEMAATAADAGTAILWDLPHAAIRDALSAGRDPAPIARDWQIRARALLEWRRVAPQRSVLIAASWLEQADTDAPGLRLSAVLGQARLPLRGVRVCQDPLGALLTAGVLASDPATRETLVALEAASLAPSEPVSLADAALRYAALIDTADAAGLLRDQLMLQQLSPSDDQALHERDAARLQDRLASVMEELHQTQADLRDANIRRKQAEDQRDQIQIRHGEMADSLAALLASRSWRITRPLRTIRMRLFRAAPAIDVSVAPPSATRETGS